MNKKYWSKLAPNTTCLVVGPADDHGISPAYITTPDENGSQHSFSALVKLEEWSDVEVVPVPLEVPDLGFLVMYGSDPSSVSYRFFERETDAAVSVSEDDDAFGYTRVAISRYGMVPKS